MLELYLNCYVLINWIWFALVLKYYFEIWSVLKRKNMESPNQNN